MNECRWSADLWFIWQNYSDLFSIKSVFLHCLVVKKERKRKEKQVLPSFPMERDNEIEFTKIPHAFLVRVIQEKITLLDSPVDLKAKPQACILHQVRQDVLS